jgi:hypothetical protein
MSEINLICEGLRHSADVWAVAVVVGVAAISKIIIVCVALRGAPPEDRQKIISALAEMFRWWRPSDRGKPSDD